MRDISLVFVIFILAFGACKFAGGKRVTGNGNITTEQRNIADFNAIEVQGSINVYVSQGSNYAVRVEAEENLMEYVVVEKDGEELEVRFKRNTNIRTKRPVNVYVTAPSYTNLAVSGSGNLISQTKITHPSQLDIDIAGSGDANLEVDAPTINAEISGSGSAILKGTTRTFNGEIGGSGELRAYNLLSERSDIDIAGSGDAEVFASKQLDVQVAGSGNINYKGNPNINKSIAGSGTVRKAD
ncbi:MAG TPA: head GIN domain-containing protein [Flavisolibacter sp.]|nr:head GIN domain-containing protein [Flavisolibacter sp.]